METKRVSIELTLSEDDCDHISALVFSLATQLENSQGIPREVAIVIAVEQLITILRSFQKSEAEGSGIEIVEREH